MKVNVNNREIHLAGREATVEELLKQLNVARETVIVVVNREISPEETELADGDEVRLLPVVSGG
ncbi:MAG: thiamine biosynthesis protein ThiS [Methanobacteriota archaeon]|nr:MAG: thiamine biosynthesis protein ThiS [Euryarchaeota archaeon]